MQEAEQIVLGLSDAQAVVMLKRLGASVFSAAPYSDVQAHLAGGFAGVDVLSGLDAEAKKKSLDAEDSVQAAKLVLTGFAKDPDLASLLVAEWGELKKQDTMMMVEPILYLGLVANLTLFLATTELEFRKGNFKFKKRRADAKILKAVLDPIASIVKKCIGS